MLCLFTVRVCKKAYTDVLEHRHHIAYMHVCVRLKTCQWDAVLNSRHWTWNLSSLLLISDTHTQAVPSKSVSVPNLSQAASPVPTPQTGQQLTRRFTGLDNGSFLLAWFVFSRVSNVTKSKISSFACSRDRKVVLKLTMKNDD